MGGCGQWKWTGGPDIRTIGSGNIGATNVLRTGNKKLAAATLLLDAMKGATAYLFILLTVGPGFALIAAFFTLLGHCFPLWLKFKGGKGVATILGAYFAINPLFGFAVCIVWLTVALIFKISSLSALIALLLAPPLAWFFTGQEAVAFFCALSLFIIYFKHRENIGRLLTGQEPKIGASSKTTGPTPR